MALRPIIPVILIMTLVSVFAVPMNGCRENEELMAAIQINQVVLLGQAKATIKLLETLSHQEQENAERDAEIRSDLNNLSSLINNITHEQRENAERVAKTRYDLDNLSSIINRTTQDQRDCSTPNGMVASGDAWMSRCQKYRCINGHSTTIFSEAQENGYRDIGGHCFYSVSLKMTWEEAREKCLSMGLDLAKLPPNITEFQQYLIDSLPGGTRDVYLGGKGKGDGKKESFYIRDDTQVPSGYWAPNEPHNNNWNCLWIRKTGDNPLYDGYCESKYNFVCEYF